MRAPFRLERYLTDLRNRTAWAPDHPLEEINARHVSRTALHRIGHLWAVALLNDRFDSLLLPVLATSTEILDGLDFESGARSWGLSRDFFRERLESRACLLLIDGVAGLADRWPGNVWFSAE